MTIRQMLFTIFIVFLSASCENNHGIHESLASVDSLLSDAKYDSAYPLAELNWNDKHK